MSDNTQSVKRSAHGTNAKAIALRMKPEERDTLTTLAEQENRTLAALARVLVLEALAARQGPQATN